MGMKNFLFLFFIIVTTLISCDDDDEQGFDLNLLTTERWNYGVPSDFQTTTRSIKFNTDGTYDYREERFSDIVEKSYTWQYIESERRIDMVELGNCFFDPTTEEGCDPPDIDFIIMSLSSNELRVQVIDEALGADMPFEQILTR